MSYQLPIIVADVNDFASAADAAYQAYKDAEGVDHGDHVHSAIEAVIDGAKSLVASGIFGAHQVQAVISGHANPNFQPTEGFAPDQVSLNLYAVAPEPEVVQATPGQPQSPAMSSPHQDQVPPPGPLGAAQTPASDYDPNAGVKDKPSRSKKSE